MGYHEYLGKQKNKLGFSGAWSMAVGGTIGGGIFSTLGVVVAGKYAWFSLNATLFSTARLARQVAEKGQLPIGAAHTLVFLFVVAFLSFMARPYILRHVG